MRLRHAWVTVAALAAGVALGAGGLALGGTGSGPEAAKDVEVTQLQARISDLQRDARFWRQLTSIFEPAKTAFDQPSMADHHLYVLPSGVWLALHFDSMNLDKAKNLNWVALALPGRFTKADQARVNRLYGPGFTHFHVFKRDVHAGRPGEKGVWFVHVGVRDFRSPFGPVEQGKVDLRFMPTVPPK